MKNIYFLTGGLCILFVIFFFMGGNNKEGLMTGEQLALDGKGNIVDNNGNVVGSQNGNTIVVGPSVPQSTNRSTTATQQSITAALQSTSKSNTTATQQIQQSITATPLRSSTQQTQQSITATPLSSNTTTQQTQQTTSGSKTELIANLSILSKKYVNQSNVINNRIIPFLENTSSKEMKKIISVVIKNTQHMNNELIKYRDSLN